MILLVVLAAMGLLSLGWVLLGWLLPSGKGCALVCFGEPDVGILSRCKWLWGMGFFRCPLIVVGEKPEIPDERIEICAGEQLLSRLETERNRFHGTGIGDSAGCDQRCGLSEL